MNPLTFKKVLLSKKSHAINHTYWAEGLLNYFPEMSYKELKSFADDFVDNYEGEDWDHHKELYKRYPFIEKDNRIFLSVWFIMFKMLFYEGWDEVKEHKLFYKELNKRINLVFKLHSSTNNP
tara:strand:+ start:132 stop:497 length:366 start_codon:yes stop_codon:yes gene_type:complete